MIVLYALLVFLLVAAHFVIARRVAALERKYTKVARETDELCRDPRTRPGNGNKPDPYAAARNAYLLGQAVERRERVEAKYVAWQKLADRFGRLVGGLRGWNGRKLPYLVGALDVVLALGAAEYLGYRDQVSARPLVEFLTSLVTKA